MKKWVAFCLGTVSGMIVTILFLLFIALLQTSDNGIKWFEKPGDTINESSFSIFQVISDNYALSHGNSVLGPVYLLVGDKGEYFYDDELVKVPKGKVAVQVGIYKYPTKNLEKTVPVIKIMDK